LRYLTPEHGKIGLLFLWKLLCLRGIKKLRIEATGNCWNINWFELTQIGDNNNPPDTGCGFGTPALAPLQALNRVSYSNVPIFGSGRPAFNNFRKFTINWGPANNAIYQFAINTDNGIPNWYVDFKSSMSFQLNGANPELSLINTGFPDLDGDYWVTTHMDNFVMVSKSGNFTIYFSNSETAPVCSENVARSEVKEDFSELVPALNQIRLYPNPLEDGFLTVTGISKIVGLKVIDVSGRVLLNRTVSDLDEIKLDLNFLNEGIYVISLENSNQAVESIRIIK